MSIITRFRQMAETYVSKVGSHPGLHISINITIKPQSWNHESSKAIYHHTKERPTVGYRGCVYCFQILIIHHKMSVSMHDQGARLQREKWGRILVHTQIISVRIISSTSTILWPNFRSNRIIMTCCSNHYENDNKSCGASGYTLV